MNPMPNNALKNPPTVFHVTHYKAGSQWVFGILGDIAGDRIIKPLPESAHVTAQPIVQGKIYPCVYLTHHAFYQSVPDMYHRIFLIIRDLRDTLVSHYFSLKHSHQILTSGQQEVRKALNVLNISDGLVYLMEKGFFVSVEIQRSWFNNEFFHTAYPTGWPWLNTDYLLIRYEDLMKNQFFCFKKILSFCNIPLSDNQLIDIIEKNSFERITSRKPGQEDVNSHYRKGISGDWKNYFDEQVTREFKRRFGYVLIETGYEQDDHWSA